MASTTTTFLKSRVTKPTVGKWSSGFSAVKKYADEHNIPIIGVWSNGDKCGHCVNFEKSCMQTAFTDWMKKSGCVFWFGYYGDTSTDDKQYGTGSQWAKNSILTTYPFVRVYWKKGKVDVSKSGSDWTGGTAKGGATFVKKLQDLLKKFDPNASSNPSESDGGCDGGSCSPGDNCCEDAKKVLEEVKSELAKLSQKVADLEKQISSCCNG